ncbi:MAG: hypothetical protein HC804_11935, partial [Anaerolineae bacterium]|nr:hypothetical protein [Anaerolineae bacterium]
GYKRYRERVLLETARAERRATWQRGQSAKEESLSPDEEGEPLMLTLLWLDETQQVKQRFPLESETMTLGRQRWRGSGR